MNARKATTAIIAASLVALAMPAHASLYFKAADETTRTGYANDMNNWWTGSDYTAHPSGLSQTDANMSVGHVCLVNTSLPRLWDVRLASNDSNHPATVRIMSGGFLDAWWQSDGVRVGAWANRYGCLDILPGGTNATVLTVGESGFGTVTNAGVWSVGQKSVIGKNAGSVGVFVHDGGSNIGNPQDITIGKNGRGELHVKSGTFNWQWYDVQYPNNLIGFTSVGCGTGGGSGLVQVENGTTFQAGITYLGGNATTVGDGRLKLRGGTYINKCMQKGKLDTMWIGAATDGNGAVLSDSYGEISGWGTVRGNANDDQSIYARFGNGRIVADGEGEERTLDCSRMWQVTNVLFGAEATRMNGWYAVNKGAVIMPGVNVALDATGGDAWGCYGGPNAVGCWRQLTKPDLVNAVFINSSVPWKGAGKNYGVMLLAEDRSDAHADALDGKYNPLGFWKAGMFDNRTGFSAEISQTINWSRVDFRYDQSKIHDAGNRIDILRWSNTNGKWERMARYYTQPADYIVSTGKITGESDDPTWHIGLYCVAEVAYEKAMTIILR